MPLSILPSCENIGEPWSKIRRLTLGREGAWLSQCITKTVSVRLRAGHMGPHLGLEEWEVGSVSD